MKLRGVARLFFGAGPGTHALLTCCARAALPAALLFGCNLDNPGIAPPKGKLAYPVAVALSTERNDDGEPRFLYVANSNFDVRYNAGSLHSYDLDELHAALTRRHKDDDETCYTRIVSEQDEALDAGANDAGPGDAGPSDAGPSRPDGIPVIGAPDGGDAGFIELPEAGTFGTPRGVLCDGRDPEGADRCCFDDNTRFLHSELHIDSFATGLALRDDGKRLYVPMRSTNDLLWVTVNDGELSCGKGNGRCRRRADESNADAPGEEFATQPTAVTVGRLAELGVTGSRADDGFIATVHERGQLSFFVESGNRAPLLQDVDPGPNRTVRATSVTVDPLHELLYVTWAGSTVVQRFGIRPRGDGVERDVLVQSTNVFLNDVSTSEDLRDLVVDSEDPTRLYALVRGYLESVVFLRLDSTTLGEARIEGVTRVASGPSKMIQATLGGRRVLLVSCYSARVIFIIDVVSREVLQVVRGLSGPFEMVVDEARELMYVADFGASVVRVVDMQGVADRSKPPPRIIATLGKLYFAGDF